MLLDNYVDFSSRRIQEAVGIRVLREKTSMVGPRRQLTREYRSAVISHDLSSQIANRCLGWIGRQRTKDFSLRTWRGRTSFGIVDYNEPVGHRAIFFVVADILRIHYAIYDNQNCKHRILLKYDFLYSSETLLVVNKIPP